MSGGNNSSSLKRPDSEEVFWLRPEPWLGCSPCTGLAWCVYSTRPQEAQFYTLVSAGKSKASALSSVLQLGCI